MTNELFKTCAAAGLAGHDAETAVASYLAHGPMTVADREALARLDWPARAAYCARRWGTDGSRVAALVAFRQVA